MTMMWPTASVGFIVEPVLGAASVETLLSHVAGGVIPEEKKAADFKEFGEPVDSAAHAFGLNGGEDVDHGDEVEATNVLNQSLDPAPSPTRRLEAARGTYALVRLGSEITYPGVDAPALAPPGSARRTQLDVKRTAAPRTRRAPSSSRWL